MQLLVAPLDGTYAEMTELLVKSAATQPDTTLSILRTEPEGNTYSHMRYQRRSPLAKRYYRCFVHYR